MGELDATSYVADITYLSVKGKKEPTCWSTSVGRPSIVFTDLWTGEVRYIGTWVARAGLQGLHVPSKGFIRETCERGYHSCHLHCLVESQDPVHDKG